MQDKNPFKELRAAINNAADIVCNKHMLMSWKKVSYAFVSKGLTRKFTADCVNEFDPRIVPVVNFINSSKLNLETGTLLRKTLNHWKKPGTRCANETETQYVTSISQVLPLKGADRYSIMCNRYKTLVLENGLEVVVADIKKGSYTVDGQWLNGNFNGLAIKVTTLLSLGLKPLEASRQALATSNVATQPVDMDHLSFD